MSGRRVVLVGGLAVAGAGGYYLYQAGGDPKVAQKEIEYDAERAKSKLKGETVSAGEAEKKGEEWAHATGRKIDQVAGDVRGKTKEADAKISAELSKAGSKLDSFTKDTSAQLGEKTKETGKALNQAIDKVDQTVEKKTSEAKKGVSSWFGFGGK